MFGALLFLAALVYLWCSITKRIFNGTLNGNYRMVALLWNISVLCTSRTEFFSFYGDFFTWIALTKCSIYINEPDLLWFSFRITANKHDERNKSEIYFSRNLFWKLIKTNFESISHSIFTSFIATKTAKRNFVKQQMMKVWFSYLYKIRCAKQFIYYAIFKIKYWESFFKLVSNLIFHFCGDYFCAYV